MKILLFLLCFATTDAFAMFEKLNKTILGRPKLRKPSVGSFYLGAGLGIPVYGLTNVGQTYVDDSATVAIQKVANNQTTTIPISLPEITLTAGYIQLSLPLRHEISLSFLNNNYSIPSGSTILTINNTSYTAPNVVMQTFFLQYYMYGYMDAKILPIMLFVGAGGGLVIFNTTLSDSASGYTINSVKTGPSSDISKISVGGTVGIAGGFTYRISDDMAMQLKMGYKVASSAFGGPSGSFPFIHVLDLNLDIFFKVL